MIRNKNKLLIFFTVICLPAFLIASPDWLKLNGISPCWPVIWLLPFSLKNGPFRSAIASVALGIFIDSFVISDVSSVLAEACLLDKPVIQILLDVNAGCFPQKDKSKNESWISEEIIKFETLVDRKSRPFKIPYIDEDWILGHLCKPEQLHETVNLVLKEPKKYEQNRNYWAKQYCWKFDGNISNRMLKMIEQFLISGKRIQL